MSWTVYCHTHIESGRRYVGLTCQTMGKRWSQHVSKSKSSKGGRWHFPNAIRIYGPAAFEPMILQKCSTLEAANAYEEYFIDLFRTRDPECGFNLAEGGQHKPHPIRKNPWDNPEYRAKQLPRLVAMGHTPEAYAKMRANARTPEFRVAASIRSKEVLATPEIREKMSRAGFAKRGKPLSSEHRAKIGVKSAARVVSAVTREKLRSYVPSVAARAKLSVASKGRRESQEERMKISMALRGRAFSEEHKKALSLATKNRDQTTVEKVAQKLRGRKLTEEHKAKISAAGKGRLMSDETKSLLSERMKRPPAFTPDGRLVRRICRTHGMLAVEECRVVNANSPEKVKFLCKQCDRVKRTKRRIENKSHRLLKP